MLGYSSLRHPRAGAAVTRASIYHPVEIWAWGTVTENANVLATAITASL